MDTPPGAETPGGLRSLAEAELLRPRYRLIFTPQLEAAFERHATGERASHMRLVTLLGVTILNVNLRLDSTCLALAPLGGVAAAAPPGHAAQFTTLYNFASNPTGGGNLVTTPVVLNNVLYGAADIGGTGGAGDGTIFKFDLATLKETTLVISRGQMAQKRGKRPPARSRSRALRSTGRRPQGGGPIKSSAKGWA